MQYLRCFQLISPGQKWHTHRKMITPTFHFKILDSFVEVFSEKSEILISKLRKEVGSKGFDVFPYVTKCTLDIICGKTFTLLMCRSQWPRGLRRRSAAARLLGFWV